MSIYIITAREFGVAKIGYSNNPRRRASTLSTANFAETKLEAVIPGDLACEAQLHELYTDKRLKGEWFSICEGIENLISLFPIGRKPRKAKVVSEASNFIDGILAQFPSQLALADEAKIPPATISSWKYGKADIPYWRREAVLLAAESLRVSLTEEQRAYLVKTSAVAA